jgi:hypothetical protein
MATEAFAPVALRQGTAEEHIRSNIGHGSFSLCHRYTTWNYNAPGELDLLPRGHSKQLELESILHSSHVKICRVDNRRCVRGV